MLSYAHVFNFFLGINILKTMPVTQNIFIPSFVDRLGESITHEVDVPPGVFYLFLFSHFFPPLD